MSPRQLEAAETIDDAVARLQALASQLRQHYAFCADTDPETSSTAVDSEQTMALDNSAQRKFYRVSFRFHPWLGAISDDIVARDCFYNLARIPALVGVVGIWRCPGED